MLYKFITSLSRSQKQIVFFLIDALAILAAAYSAVLLSVNTSMPAQMLSDNWTLFGSIVAFGLAASWALRLPRIKLNAYETRGIIITSVFAAITAVSGVVVNAVSGAGIATGYFVVFGMALLVICATWRIALRQITIQIYRRGEHRLRVLIYGAGQTGQQLVAALRTDDSIQPVAFADDNPALQSLVVSGLKVHAPLRIKELVRERQIDRVILAMPSISQPKLARIAHSLRSIGCEVHALPSFAELVGHGEMKRSVTPVSIDDLLGRNRLERDLPEVSEAYSNRRIMITGAGGSIGSELCRQMIACKPECLVLVDHSELALYEIHKELKDVVEDITVVPVLGSVLNEQSMRHVLEKHDIEVVIHAAAYKHLPMVEDNPIEGLQNNVFGTKILADLAGDAGVERFILVSSDKAVRPTNVMGASKRLAELVIQDLANRAGTTRYSMVRFGNVLGSSGSVIPLFKEQIARGGPVTLTDPEVTRYFMTISEAARLVLLAGSFSRGGDLFVLDMGDPIPILKLATQMIEASGYSVKDANNPGGDIEIEVTGLRKGEKLHEELLIAPDMLTTPHAKILRAQEGYLSEIEVATALKDLRRAIDTLDAPAARQVLERWVEGEGTKAKPSKEETA